MRVNGDTAAVPDRIPLRLDPGSHSSAREGVCIVELASVIGGEEFSDRPECVCPVIAAFLRAWNDRAGHADRQRLVPYAERIVGTRAGPEVTRARRDICLEWAGADLEGGVVRRSLATVGMRARIGAICGMRYGLRLDQGAGEYAARSAFSGGVSERAFTLLDALLEDEADAPSEPARVNGARSNGHAHRLWIGLRPGPAGNGRSARPDGSNGRSARPNGSNGRSARPNGSNGRSATANGDPDASNGQTAAERHRESA